MGNCMNYFPYTLPDVSFIGGSTQHLVFEVLHDISKLPFDLSECTAQILFVDSLDKNGDPLIDRQMEILHGDFVDNILSVVLVPDDTIDKFGKYIYQISITDSLSDKTILLQGRCYIYQNIDL